MSQSPQRKTEIHELLAQADLLLLLGRWLAPPWRDPLPQQGSVNEEDIVALIRAAGLDDSRAELRDTLIAALKEMEAVRGEDWRDEYTGLFEGNIPCPINETAYIRRDKGTLLADIAGFHQAFGFELSGDVHEKPDHLVCELQFLAVLLVMQAEALREGRPDRAEVTADAASAFASDHLGEWVSAFCERLEELTSLAVMQRIAGALRQSWRAIAMRRGFTLSDEPIGERALPDEQTGGPYECGMAEHERGDGPPVHLSVNGVRIPR